MKVAVIGTGAVGQAMATKLSLLGHKVFMGTRNVSESRSKTKADGWGTPGVGSWIKDHPKVELLTFREAAEQGRDLIVFAVQGMAAFDCLEEIGKDQLNNRILVDITNPLDFSKGMPPSLGICNTESLGEKIQERYPELKVVKALNTVSSAVMGNPGTIEGDHNLFICGNDQTAKKQVIDLLTSFGWREHNIIDMGDITSARGTEMLMPLFIRLLGKYENPFFNFHVKRSTQIPA